MSANDSHKASNVSQFVRALLIATYFFLLIVGYYLLKPLSRTLYITYLGSVNLPYVWLATILVLSIIIPIFHFKIKKFRASDVIAVLIGSFICFLSLFKILFSAPSQISAFAFYVLVDVYSVLIVESFWSLANSSYRTKEGSQWYGVVASGGLIGGLVGGWGASLLIERIKISPFDLIIYSIPIFIVAFLLVRLLFKIGLVGNELSTEHASTSSSKELLKSLIQSPRIKMLTILLCMAQLIEPLVEYQFMFTVEQEILTLKDRTQYISEVFALVSVFGLVVNLVVISLVHSRIGVLGGLLLQPCLIIITSAFQLYSATLQSSALSKIVDRGLAYSSGRASRELLFTELGVRVIYSAKAWIDVYGYRLFRIFGSILVLIITWWQSDPGTKSLVIFMIIFLSIVWICSIFTLKDGDNSKTV